MAFTMPLTPDTLSLTVLTDDPPFYMTNHANYVPTNFVASEDGRAFGVGGGGRSRMDSENEDLRGVIDDLTIENKRLKHAHRILQRSQRGTPSEVSQSQDKLFEVRMHTSLQPEKRRELEMLLKDFATSVHVEVPSKPQKTSSSQGSASGTSNGLNAQKHGATRTDSGYASNTPSHGASALNTPVALPSKPANNRAVRSYLQDIPNALLPKRNPILSERSKQALVVRRLEQLFTGRLAAPGEHNHPMQQQEISKSAARDDRAQDARNNKKRKAEGTREAHIMAPDSKVNLDAMDYVEANDESKKMHSPTDTSLVSRPGSPDQRPTRPLDLDIHRAQAAAENLHYMRHLGLSLSQPGVVRDGEESQWLFLNLLSGLAQLHTLNVTQEFIRRAIKKLSRQFELSKDGQRVRWVGGSEGTRFAPEDEKAIETIDVSPHESAEDGDTGGSSKRSKTTSSDNAAITSNTTSEEHTSRLQTDSDSKPTLPTVSGTSGLQSSSLPITLPTSNSQSTAFDYKPIVLRQRTIAEVEEWRDSDESYDSSSGDSSGLVNALSRSNLNQKSKDEGVITFFNNPFFCSDYSSEQEPSNMLPPRPVIVGEILGIPVPPIGCESPLRYHDGTYFTPQFAQNPFDPESLSENGKARFKASLPKLPTLAPISEAGESETVPIEMEVCGLGGVTPDDNFALDVKTVLKPAPTRGPDAVVRQLPFSRRKYLQKYTTRVSSCRKIDLLPSKLPPPSYIFFHSSSSSDHDDESVFSEESDSSSSPFVDEEYPAPPAFLQQFSGSSGEEPAEDDDEDMDSSSIDMLAIARQANPQQIAEQERLYVVNQPGGTIRTVAGSLAATVGASRSGSSRYAGDERSDEKSDERSSVANASMKSVDADSSEDEDEDDMSDL